MLDLMSPELRLNPFPLYAQMREQSPVLFVPGPDIWLVFRYDDVRTVLSDHARFSSQQREANMARMDSGLDGSLPSLDPPRHTQLRGLISKAFTPKAIADLEPRIRQVTHDLLDEVSARGQMDLVDDLAVPLPIVVITEMVGIPIRDRVLFKRWARAVIATADEFVTGRVDEEAARDVAEMMEYFRGLIAQRRAKPGADMISQLMAVEVDGQRLTENELLSFCWLLLVAGTETTTSLVGNAILSLLENPDQMALLRAHPELVPSAVEETLRYRSPAQLMFRAAAVDTELGGQTIRAGQRVLAFIGSANRDGAAFPDPDRFDITRSPNQHIAFSHGIHHCLGAPLARLEGRVVLSILLERLQNLERLNDAPLEPQKGILVYGLQNLPLKFTPAVPAGA